MTIREIALKKKQEYDDAYYAWRKENPGSIMNGLSSMSMAAREACYCDTKEDIETLLKISKGRLKDSDGVNGHLFYVQAFEDILKEIEKL
jgi:hypothetical protein